MTYLPRHRGRGLGDDELSSVLSALPGGSSTPVGVDAPAYLALQVNRFTGPDAPDAIRVADVPYPVTSGQVGSGVASAAVVIGMARARDAAVGGMDPLAGKAFAEAAQNLVNPVAFVTANLPAVTQTVQQYADMKGLPKASVLGALSPVTLAIGAGAVALVVVLVTGAGSGGRSRGK